MYSGGPGGTLRPFLDFRVARILLVAGTASCWSRWDVADDVKLPYGCVGQLNWYPDCDLDGFGDPDAQLVTTECQLELDASDAANSGCPVQEGVIPLAANQIDCDDADPDVTARTGICPKQIGEGLEYNPVTQRDEMLEAPSECVHGVLAGGVEYVATCGNSPQLDAAEARSSCVRWGGSLADPEAEEESDGFVGLARVRTESEGLTNLLAELEADGVRALWIDLSYDFEEGTWSYENAGADNLPQSFLPCPGDAPTLADFVEDVNPDLVNQDSDGDGVPDSTEREVGTDPDDASSVSDARPSERLALIKRDGQDAWCWGAPGRFGLPVAEAYTMCQRPPPKADLYAEAPAAEE